MRYIITAASIVLVLIVLVSISSAVEIPNGFDKVNSALSRSE